MVLENGYSTCGIAHRVKPIFDVLSVRGVKRLSTPGRGKTMELYLRTLHVGLSIELQTIIHKL